MAQHFLLSSSARTLSLAKILRMSEAEAELEVMESMMFQTTLVEDEVEEDEDEDEDDEEEDDEEDE